MEYCHNTCHKEVNTVRAGKIIRCATCGSYIDEVRYTYKKMNEAKIKNKQWNSYIEERRFKASKAHRDYVFEERD